jgi:DNA-binding response OmpR family regulator
MPAVSGSMATNPPEIQALLIEDNPEHSLLLGRILSSSDVPTYHVVNAATLSEGLAKLKAGNVEIILLDLTLPDSQGIRTFERVSAAAPDLPVVILSGVNDVGLAIEIVQAGAQDYLVKGHVDNQLLLRSIQYAIERKRGQSALRKANDELEARVEERTAELSDANRRLQREIAERKLAERQALESNQQLMDALAELRSMQQDLVRRERYQALGHMANGIAHEFNNVLTPIVGYCEHLLNTQGAMANQVQVRGFLEKIRTSALAGASAVSRVRDFARAESGVLEPVNVAKLLEDVIALTEPKWKGEAQAAGKTVAITHRTQGSLEVQGDAAQLRELMTHLIFNAVRAIPKRGMIRLEAAVCERGVVLTVSDDGAGMSDEVRRQCLDSSPSAETREGRLAGYGVVRGIIAHHSGRLEIESTEGRGTRVTVILPAAVSRVAPPPAPVEAGAPRKLKILVADDEPMVREVISIYLTDDGHDVELAVDGREALEKFNKAKFDLVMTDRAMPDVNGDQLAAEVKRLRPEVPVILLTGFGDLMNSAGERPPGVDAVVPKPFTMSALRAALAEIQ